MGASVRMVRCNFARKCDASHNVPIVSLSHPVYAGAGQKQTSQYPKNSAGRRNNFAQTQESPTVQCHGSPTVGTVDQ